MTESLYYNGYVSGEWKFQRAERYSLYQLIGFNVVMFTLVIIASYAIRLNISHNFKNVIAGILFVVLILNLFFFHLEYEL